MNASPPRTRLTAAAASARSPLRYPGGKSRAVRQIVALFPPGLETLVSPFIGGGSVELDCAARGVTVHGYDAFEPLVAFWQAALADAEALADRVAERHPLSRTEFYHLQKRIFSIDDRMEQAAAFYALNRASYSGATLSGGMSPGHPRFTESAIDRLRAFSSPNLTVKPADFKDSIAAHATDFLYLDPPYLLRQKLYGARGDMHDGFDHAALAALLRARDGWVLSYNDCPETRDLYRGHRIHSVEWTYGMNNNRRESSEVIILGGDVGRAA